MEGRPRVVSPEGAGWPEPDFRVPDHGEVPRALTAFLTWPLLARKGILHLQTP